MNRKEFSIPKKTSHQYSLNNYWRSIITFAFFCLLNNCTTTSYSTLEEYDYILVDDYILIGEANTMNDIRDFTEEMTIDSLRYKYGYCVLPKTQSFFSTVETEEDMVRLINMYNHEHWSWSANDVENEWKNGDRYRFIYLLLSKGYKVYSDCETGTLIIRDKNGNVCR